MSLDIASLVPRSAPFRIEFTTLTIKQLGLLNYLFDSFSGYYLYYRLKGIEFTFLNGTGVFELSVLLLSAIQDLDSLLGFLLDFMNRL